MDNLTQQINASVDRMTARQRLIDTRLQGVPGEFLVHLPQTDDPAALEAGAQTVLQRFNQCAPEAAAERDRAQRENRFRLAGLSHGEAALAASTKMPESPAANTGGASAPDASAEQERDGRINRLRMAGMTPGEAAFAASIKLPNG